VELDRLAPFRPRTVRVGYLVRENGLEAEKEARKDGCCRRGGCRAGPEAYSSAPLSISVFLALLLIPAGSSASVTAHSRTAHGLRGAFHTLPYAAPSVATNRVLSTPVSLRTGEK
jgi:hypothetical protein